MTATAWGGPEKAPRWAAILFVSGAGAMFVTGVMSILYFLAVLFVPRFPAADLVLEGVVLAWFIYVIARRRGHQSKPGQPPSARAAPTPPTLVPAAALLIAFLLATLAMSKSWDLNSQGNWDAWAIWNLRAKFLASPDLAARAWSPLLSNTHPEYPLLLSGAIARFWALSGAAPDAVPIAIAYVFFLSLVAAVTGGIAILRGPAAGLVAGLMLASCAALLHEVPSQYADVPIAAYIACAVVFVLLDRPVWAGVFAGFAAWTKDEGALFCVVLLALLLILRPREVPRAILGMLPGALVFLAFKLFLAPHVGGPFSAGALAHLDDSGRWGVVLGGVSSQIVSLGAGWFHPLWIWIAFAIGVRFRPQLGRGSRSDAWFSTAVAAAILAGYSVVLVISPNDVAWQTGTAAGRLVVQWWPLAAVALSMWLRPAEDWIVEPAPAKKKRK